MVESTGGKYNDVVKATVTAIDIFAIEKYWQHIESLDYKVTADTQAVMMTRLTRLLRRATRWLLRHEDAGMSFTEAKNSSLRHSNAYGRMFPQKLPPDFQQMYQEKFDDLLAAGVLRESRSGYNAL